MNMTDDSNYPVKTTSSTAQVSHVFGPVPSRRLGRSLGIDLVPFKTCTYDCIYCQLGRTTNKTTERQEWVPYHQLIEELKAKLISKPDYITLSGSGEPTLYSRIEELIRDIKKITTVPVAILTNGSLLWQPEVRWDIMEADLVIPSLDAGEERLFQYINRPCPEIGFGGMLDGLIEFRQEYRGQYWLEVFVNGGVTDTENELRNLSACIRKIHPDRLQVNTVTRPPAESYAIPVTADRMQVIASQLADNAEIIADYRHVHDQEGFAAEREDVLELIRRRPCTLEDISDGLRLHRNGAVKHLEKLQKQGKICTKLQNNAVYYTIPGPQKPRLK